MRDMLLGRRVGDYDMTTSARPDQVMKLFPRCVPTGLRHGTVTVLDRQNRIEVTTYRVESGYRDSRHPDRVRFAETLEEDLARRDFTINAMAMNLERELRDVYGGQEDLAAGLIRCVGNPDGRFSEDALRMLRALRFSSQLFFEIEPQTMAALERNARLTEALSPERVRDELEKLLLSGRPELVGEAVRLGMLDRFVRNRGGDYTGLLRVRKDRLERWTAFCALSGEAPDTLLTALRLDRTTVRAVVRGAAIRGPEPREPADWKRLLRDHGVEAVSAWTAAQDARNGTRLGRQLRKALSAGEPYRITDLAVNGDDLAVLGIRSRAAGRVLRALSDAVIRQPALNQRETLLELVRTGCIREKSMIE